MLKQYLEARIKIVEGELQDMALWGDGVSPPDTFLNGKITAYHEIIDILNMLESFRDKGGE